MLLSETHHIARKRHTCGECTCSIQPGEKYLAQAGINYDGDFSWWCLHIDCEEASQYLHRLEREDEHIRLVDREPEDIAILKDIFPSVWARFNVP
jgi:hypothetical protein